MHTTLWWESEGNSPFVKQTCRWTIILERKWLERRCTNVKTSDLGHGPVVGYCEHCNGTGASTMRIIYLMELKGVYWLPRNDSAPCSHLKSWMALSSVVFIHLQQPTSPTYHRILTFPIRIQTWITVKYFVLTQLQNQSASVINANQLMT